MQNIKTKIFSFCGILLIPLAACAPVSQSQYEKRGLEPLDTSAIEKLLAGTTFQLESIDFNGSVFFRENMKIAAKDQWGGEDSGSWSLEPEDRICIKFRSWYFGDTNCYRIIEENNNKILFFSSNGAIRYTGIRKQVDSNGKTDKKRTSQGVKQEKQPRDSKFTPPENGKKESVKDRFVRLARNCPDCNLSGVDLSGAHLANANLAGANLAGANLTGANLRLANLAGADLSEAQLIRTNLPGANLTGANLTGANLSGSNLIRADITNATLKNTDFSGAHLESIQGKIE